MFESGEFKTRMATAEDAALIGEQRHRMFVDSGPRRQWLTWTAVRPTPRASCLAELAAWRAWRRATESAPPEMATQRRSPGLMWVRSKARVGETDIAMRIQFD